jgi:predicted molibdopterin-dependent oxidoreductase YjgC
VIQLSLDGQPVAVPSGTTIWQAARMHGIDIPVLCHQPHLHPVGVCRLCVVDVGGRVLAASCVRECEPGMNVRTVGDDIDRQRSMLVALLLAEHPAPCAKEKTTGDCELEAYARKYGLMTKKPDFLQTPGFSAQRPADVSSQVIAVDHAACIDRCIRACDDVQSNEVIGRMGKGHNARIAFDLDTPMGESTCVSCGECVQSCPTGALINKPLAGPLVPRAQTTAVESVCPYCGVGCALTYHVKPGPFVEVHPHDLARLDLADGSVVIVRSRRGAIRLPVRASEAVASGSVFIPFHFREAAANMLTNDVLDPFGKIPEFKFCAVCIEKGDVEAGGRTFLSDRNGQEGPSSGH